MGETAKGFVLLEKVLYTFITFEIGECCHI